MQNLERKIRDIIRNTGNLLCSLEIVGDNTCRKENRQKYLKIAKEEISEIYKAIKQIKVSEIS